MVSGIIIIFDCLYKLLCYTHTHTHTSTSVANIDVTFPNDVLIIGN